MVIVDWIYDLFNFYQGHAPYLPIPLGQPIMIVANEVIKSIVWNNKQVHIPNINSIFLTYKLNSWAPKQA